MISHFNKKFSDNEVVDFLDHLNFQSQIRPIIEQHASLPDKGILAGGSLSNAISHLLYGTDPLINDVDVFVKEDYLVAGSLSQKSDKIELLHEYDRIVAKSRSGYGIVKSYRSETDKLNTIAITQSHNTDFADTLIRSFDINQTRVAYDLNSSQLHYTSDYVEFLKNRQLSIVSSFSPLSTSLRLFKKHKELPFTYLDAKYEMMKLSFVMLESLPSEFLTMGDDKLLKFQDYLPEVEKYFYLERIYIESGSSAKNKKYLYTIVPREYDSCNSSVYYLQDFPGFISSQNESDKKEFTDCNSDIKHKEYNTVQGAAIKWEHFHGHNSKRSLIAYYSKVYSLNVLAMVAITNIDFFDEHNIPYEQLESMNTLFNKHNGLIVGRNNITLSNLYHVYKLAKTFENKYGIYAIGMLETDLKHNDKLLSFNYEQDIKHLESLIKTEMENKEKSLCTRLPLLESYTLQYPPFAQFSIKELTTGLELLVEGTTMSHCVGGYSYRIHTGMSRIFHIAFSDNDKLLHTTVEVKVSYNSENQVYELILIQASMFANKSFPMKYANDIVSVLSLACSTNDIQRILSDDYNGKIKDHNTQISELPF
jgi:hypothetical protein